MIILEFYRELVGGNDSLMDFHPSHENRQDFLKKVALARNHKLPRQFEVVFAPSTAFTNRVVHLGEDDDPWTNDFVRTSKAADGGIVHGPGQAVALFSADCPTIALAEGDKLAVLHGGFRNLVRLSQEEPNIIEVAMQHFNAPQTHALVCNGIDACCWVPGWKEGDPEEHYVRDLARRYPRHTRPCLYRTSEDSPYGKDLVSISLPLLIQRLLVDAGIPSQKIRADDRCTCCAKKKSKPCYWSHTRFKAGKQSTDGRNLSIVSLR